MLGEKCEETKSLTMLVLRETMGVLVKTKEKQLVLCLHKYGQADA